MSNKRTKGQHYIPRAAYLEQFADHTEKQPVVYVYPSDQVGVRPDKENGIPPAQVCKETYMYESPRMRVNALENYLAEVEGRYRAILLEKIVPQQPLTSEEKLIVSLFVTTLEARVPAARENALGFLDDVLDKVRKLEEQFDNGRVSDTRRQIEDEKRNVFAEQVAISAEINRWRFSQFLFLHNDQFFDPGVGGYFITSDNPVTLYDFTMMNSLYGVPPLSKTAEVCVPLTPTVLLFINNQGIEGHTTIQPNFISEANNRILAYASGRIISPVRVTERAAHRFMRRNRQSFILQYQNFRQGLGSEPANVDGDSASKDEDGPTPHA